MITIGALNDAQQQALELATLVARYSVMFNLGCTTDNLRQHHTPVLDYDCINGVEPTREELDELASPKLASALVAKLCPELANAKPRTYLLCIWGWRTLTFCKRRGGIWSCRRALINEGLSAPSLDELIQLILDYPGKLPGSNFFEGMSEEPS